MPRYEMVSGKFYRKVGGQMRRYRPGDIFTADPYEVRRLVESGKARSLDEVPTPIEPEVQELVRPKQVRAVHRGANKYDVVDEDGKKINMEPLTKVEAESLAETAGGGVLEKKSPPVEEQEEIENEMVPEATESEEFEGEEEKDAEAEGQEDAKPPAKKSVGRKSSISSRRRSKLSTDKS